MRWRSTALLLAVLAFTGCRGVRPAWSVETTNAATLRATRSGPVLGGEGRYGSHAWLGIPFAAPPVGPLRWRAPQEAASWKEPLVATHFGRSCMQPASPLAVGEEGRDGVLGSEDCLTLNVWAPRFEPAKVPQGEARLPVMVWIHGGGNSLGSASAYDLGHLAVEQQVVAIAVNYRLGPLGWFRNSALQQGADSLDASGNFGTLDLVRALEWVRDNAETFGGDPARVTVFGESAGGQNTYSMLLSPKAKGLFHRAIAQSPVLSRTRLADAEAFSDDPAGPGNPNSSNEALARLMVRDGSAADRAAAKTRIAQLGPAKVAEYLRAVPADELLRSYVEANAGNPTHMLAMPLVFPDGVVLPADKWVDAFSRADGWNQVPVIIGTNREEAKLFLVINPKFTWRLFGVLPRMRDESLYEATSEVVSRLWRASAIDEVAQAMRASGEADVYSYRFDWAKEPKKFGSDFSKLVGAAHGVEIPFVFGHFEGELQQFLGEDGGERDQLSGAMRAWWGQFARAGKPGRGGGETLPEWTPYDVSAPEAPKFMTLDSAPAGLKMGNTVEHAGEIIAAALADPRFPERSSKCEGLELVVKAGFATAEQVGDQKDCVAPK